MVLCSVAASAKGFENEEALVEYYKIHSDKMVHAVVFKGLETASTLPLTVTYYMRPKTEDSQKWRTAITYPFYQTGKPRSGSDPGEYGVRLCLFLHV